jgi:hypothetical protein
LSEARIQHYINSHRNLRVGGGAKNWSTGAPLRDASVYSRATPPHYDVDIHVTIRDNNLEQAHVRQI